MRKLWLICLLVSGCALLMAQDTAKPQADPVVIEETVVVPVAKVYVEPTDWDIFQLGFWFNNPVSQDTIGATGFRIGAPFCGGLAPVYGIEGAILGSGSEQVNGLQFGLCTAMADQINGAQVAFYTQAREVNGVQIGIVNCAKEKSFQIGLINFIEDGFLPWCILFNFKF